MFQMIYSSLLLLCDDPWMRREVLYFVDLLRNLEVNIKYTAGEKYDVINHQLVSSSISALAKVVHSNAVLSKRCEYTAKSRIEFPSYVLYSLD